MQRRFFLHKPYDWQKEFHNAGSYASQRLLMAGNGVGKTRTGAYEIAVHMTGLYPQWWEGKRFDRPVKVWCCAISNTTQRDAVQPALLGSDLQDGLGTGLIPAERIAGKPKTRQSGIPDVADNFRVLHISGGYSNCLFKVYEQGWRAFQSADPDIIWMDEQHDENKVDEKPIFDEVITRLMRSGGILLVTLTPLLGETDMIRHFVNSDAKGVYIQGATWDDAPHLSEEQKALALATYPEHQRKTRTMGIPLMGEGAVFTTAEEDALIDDFPIPDHFARIKGVDFGIDHPCAVVDMAWDRDKDIVYFTRSWKKSNADLAEHVEAINHKTPWVPVSWPHDGANRDKRDGKSGIPLKDEYVKHHVKMLGRSACYKNDTQGSQPVEPIILEVNTRLIEGRLKIFKSCSDLRKEYRSYHRKDGRVVARHDDCLKAAFYALMMRRYAMTNTLGEVRRIAQPRAFTMSA